MRHLDLDEDKIPLHFAAFKRINCCLQVPLAFRHKRVSR